MAVSDAKLLGLAVVLDGTSANVSRVALTAQPLTQLNELDIFDCSERPLRSK